MSECVTLGSLFDGIGAIPYAASFFGIKTLWASEILPNAVSVTRRHFPEMLHLGDVTKLDGGKIPPVDIIAFGSPCQSWSVAGDRTGLDGKSRLFMEAIRIIREMRKATNGRKPQIALFENVLGLLNCGAGGRSNYQAVLEAFCETEIPMPKSGRWANAGMVRGRGIDLAWVVKDSQYHRTAQRRKRLFVIVDFAGQRASEILFVSKSLSGYFAAREGERERTAAASESGIRSTITVVNDQGGNSLSIEKDELSPTLRSQAHGNLPIVCAAFMAGQAKNARSVAYSETLSPTLKGSPSGLNQMPCICEPTVYGICSDKSNSMLSSNPHSGIYKAETCRTLDRNCANPNCNQGGMVILEPQPDMTYCLQGNMIGRQDKNGPQGSGVNKELCFTISATDHHAVATFMRQRSDSFKQNDLASTQTARQYKDATDLICQSVAAVDCRNLNESEISGTLQSKCSGGYSLNYQNPLRLGYIVRRLTPMEAERLMSLPDGWTEYGHDGKLMSDSARYQMCGNSIVVNVLAYIFLNISNALGTPSTATPQGE